MTLALVLTTTGVFARPRIAVMPFTGPKAAKVKAQVAKTLCASFTCVTPKKGSELTVDAVVTGAVGKRAVELKVYTDEETAPSSRSLALGAGAKLSKKSLAEAPGAVKEALKLAATEAEDASGAQP